MKVSHWTLLSLQLYMYKQLRTGRWKSNKNTRSPTSWLSLTWLEIKSRRENKQRVTIWVANWWLTDVSWSEFLHRLGLNRDGTDWKWKQAKISQQVTEMTEPSSVFTACFYLLLAMFIFPPSTHIVTSPSQLILLGWSVVSRTDLQLLGLGPDYTETFYSSLPSSLSLQW